MCKSVFFFLGVGGVVKFKFTRQIVYANMLLTPKL